MRGDIQWMVYAESVNPALFTACPDCLIQDIEGKIFLIAGRARYHTPKDAAAWPGRHKDRIGLLFMPPYSPDMNPGEWVRKNVKQDSMYRVVPQAPGQLFAIASKPLRALWEAPGKIRRFFSDPNLSYIRRACA